MTANPKPESSSLAPETPGRRSAPSAGLLAGTDMTRRVEATLRSLYYRHLHIILPTVLVYYSFLTASHYFALQGDFRVIMMTLSAAAAAGCAILYGLARVGSLRSRHAHIAFVPIGLLAIANIYVHIILSGDQIHLTNSVLALTAFGFLVLHPVIYAGMMTCTLILYAACLFIVPGPFAAHFGFLMIASLVVGIIGYQNRYRTLSKQTQLALENAAKARIMNRMNREVEEQAKAAEHHAEVAEKALEAKSRFLANTSHELRTPLTGVLGMVDLLEQTRIDPNQKEMTSAIRSSANGLLSILNDILDFAKLEEGGLELRPQPFQPGMVLNQVITMLRSEADKKSLNLVSENRSPELLWLMGDSNRLGQVLFNLVSNAIKYTERGIIRVSLSTEPIPGSSGRAQLAIAVTDTGVGIDKAVKDKLFDRFSQVDTNRDRRGAGVGLGLAISKEIMELMEGTLSIDSEPNIGSTVIMGVALPLAEAPKITNADDARQTPDANQSVHILLAEDNSINQMLLKKLLTNAGYRLTMVDNGRAAVDAALAASPPFDIILMDIQMPELDGVSALAVLQEKMADRPPVIAITANTSEEEISLYKKAGFDGFVGKPLDEKLLNTEIARLLSPPPPAGDPVLRLVSS